MNCYCYDFKRHQIMVYGVRRILISTYNKYSQDHRVGIVIELDTKECLWIWMVEKSVGSTNQLWIHYSDISDLECTIDMIYK